MQASFQLKKLESAHKKYSIFEQLIEWTIIAAVVMLHYIERGSQTSLAISKFRKFFDFLIY